MCKTVILLPSNLRYLAIQVSDPIDPSREILAMPGLPNESVFPLTNKFVYPAILNPEAINGRIELLIMYKTIFLLTSNLMYPAIQISVPIDPMQQMLDMPGWI